MIGKARVTDRVAFSLSSVTARGVARTSDSLSELRKETTALTPSALRKAVTGLNPRAVFKLNPPLPTEVTRLLIVWCELMLPVPGATLAKVPGSPDVGNGPAEVTPPEMLLF